MPKIQNTSKPIKKILISSVGGDIGYGIIKALNSSHHDFYYVGMDINKINMAYDCVDKFYVAPPYSDHSRWMDFVLNVIKTEKIDYFVPVSETEIKIVNKNKEFFSNVDVLINNSNILNICLDKYLCMRFLENNGFFVPKTWLPEDNYEKKYPLVIKSVFGCGSTSVKIVKNEVELKDALISIKEPIIQQYLSGTNNEYTLTVFSNRKIVNYIMFRRTLGPGGMSIYVELINDERIKILAHRLADLFELNGSINVQMRFYEGNYYIFEINPRISSTIGFRFRCGFNDVMWWIDSLSGNYIEEYVLPNQHICGVRSIEEKIFYK